MKELRFTTSQPGFFGSTSEPLIVPDNVGEFINIKEQKCKSCFIHGDAENLAGFDIPIFLDGDLNNLNLPIEEQNITMLLPSGEYKCKCTIEKDLIDNAYYLTLKK